MPAVRVPTLSRPVPTTHSASKPRRKKNETRNDRHCHRGAFAVAASAAAQADNSQGDFLFENYFNSSNDPHATTNGLIWIDTGNGVPFLTPNPVYSYDGDYPPPASDSTSWDLNIELLGGTLPSSLADLACDTSSGGGSASCTTLLLLSVQGGATVWNGTPVPNSGEFDTSSSPNPGGFNDSSLGYVYQVPGNTTFGLGLFPTPRLVGRLYELQRGAGRRGAVGTTPVFVNSVQNGLMPIPDLEQMPALILRSSLPGDANLDGKVDINDLTIVLSHYGQSGQTWADGEFTGDGTVDINDLTIVLAHYGGSVGSADAAMSAVPEPGALRCC